ncbi:MULTISPECIES: hypothetical protein [unclassified Methanoregula]|uniref:hypothetical protein n=1 Tax=unclassified Methanoregula TaxID=2649730 RepID=UPI0009CF36DB|nr:MULTISPECIES: hypothetical protein [unclassified Methanoregula]OPX64150.1 MAG: hypothetical protein A4E33_01174 [Methanoregula sp. PtaB.Bin085]OPY34730.1 MAG: hypothetical protein A4E34_01259 [Methanoregula sp. PtaU1.Bin006]
MRQFTPKAGTKSATCTLDRPFPDIGSFNAVVQDLIVRNPLGCTSYRTPGKHHPPVVKVRERYTAKFVYEDGDRKQIGSSSEVYNSVEGYEDGIHAVMANVANIAAHRGRARHVPEADRYTVILKCHDESGELFFLSLARDRITVASYTDDAIRKNVARWTDRMLAATG